MPEAAVGKAAIADALFRIGALRFGRFTLSSGKSSSYYLDLRMIPSYPDTYAAAVEAYAQLAEAVGSSRFDVVAGVATAGVTISSPLALRLGKPMVYVRRDGKAHGLGRLIEGAVLPGWRALVVDDLVTTGDSILAAADALRKGGCRVTDAVVLVDRLEGGEANLAGDGVKLRSFANVKELIDILYGAGKVTKRDYETVVRQVGNKGS